MISGKYFSFGGRVRIVLPLNCLMMLFTIGGCTYAVGTDTVPDKGMSTQPAPYYFDARWMRDHESDIVASAQQFIDSRHPTVDAGFPNIQVSRVTIVDSSAPIATSADSQKTIQAENQLRDLFNSLSHKLVSHGKDSPTWLLDVDVQFRYPEPGPGRVALAVPDMVLCFSTIFVACPDIETEEVVFDVHVTEPNGEKFRFVTAGDAHLFMSTVVVGDNDDPDRNGLTAKTTRALVAAMVGATDKLVDKYKSEKNSAAHSS
jgi:hypothetical protein